MERPNHFFARFDASALIQDQLTRASDEIARMDGDRLLNTNVEDLVNYVVAKYRLDVPVLDEPGMSVDQQEATRDVSGDPLRWGYLSDRGPVFVTGTEVVVEVPVDGDIGMFDVCPNTRDTAPPRGEIRGSAVQFRYWSDNPQASQIRLAIDQWLVDIKRYLGWLHDTFKHYNDSLADRARTTILQRRGKLLANRNLVSALGIPVKQRPGTKGTYIAPEVKRKIAPKLPPASAGEYKPEPVLDDAEYQHILEVLEGMVKVMERSPKAFQHMDEETLRTHFLVQLNGHYEGQATGETFNYQGKTDILVRSGDRNVFIAECKFWSGPTRLTETIDQLLGYTSQIGTA